MKQRVCDRCKTVIENTNRFRLNIQGECPGHKETGRYRDLCEKCYLLFLDYMDGEAIPPMEDRK